MKRILRRERRGSSSPVIAETELGLFVLKLRGAAQGTAALVAEVIVGALADVWKRLRGERRFRE